MRSTPGRRAPQARIIALLVGSLTACAFSADAAETWSNALMRRGVDPALVENPIALTPEIAAAAEAITGRGGAGIDELESIQAAILDRSRFTFVYDERLTETASAALASGRGNCVAFTNLFIAMARSRGLRVKAGYMTPRSLGERRGDLIYVATHVAAVYRLHERNVVFDFYESRQDPATPLRILDDLELAALYVNNRAVEALSNGDSKLAESLLNAAVKLAPKFAGAHGNLGLVRKRRGDVAGALDAYREALALDPRDPAILGNLAALYAGIGRDREARTALALADPGRATPYTYLARGDLEAVDGHASRALRLYRRAARLDPRIPDPHVALARLALSSGDSDEARREAERAAALDPANEDARDILRRLASR